MGLIDKDIIVAEIEKKIKQYKNERNTIIKDTDNSKELASRIIMCQEIISFLDTIEVKEVDLDKELKTLDDMLFDLEGVAVKGATSYLTVNDVKDIAKHFFELGLKTKKGE